MVTFLAAMAMSWLGIASPAPAAVTPEDHHRLGRRAADRDDQRPTDGADPGTGQPAVLTGFVYPSPFQAGAPSGLPRPVLRARGRSVRDR